MCRSNVAQRQSVGLGIARKLISCCVANFAGNAHWAEPSPLFAHRARSTPLKCRNEYLVLAIGEEISAQAVVGSIDWAFCRLKKPKSFEMSARGYALHSVCLQLSFPLSAFYTFAEHCHPSIIGKFRAQLMIQMLECCVTVQTAKQTRLSAPNVIVGVHR